MKFKLLKSAMAFGAILLCLGFVSAQTVSGNVSDASGPLPGATVIIKGTSNGTSADFDGNYTIQASSGDVLVFSYVGYSSVEVTVGSQDTINVVLESANELEEVVVTGYGTQTRGNITGAVTSVDVSEATKTPLVNAAEALQGRVAGVTVTSNNTPGAAPKIVIRGFGTSNNTNPLYVIDGVQTDDASVLNSINPNDIEQMNVLKDGAAAIYGARASNGVIIITTKSGGYNMEKAKISVDAYSGLSTAINLPELLNAQQHAQMTFDSYKNDGVTFNHPQYGSGSSPVVPSVLNGYTRVVSYDPIVKGPATARIQPGGTDWLDEVLQSAMAQNASISLQNGNSVGKYLMSASFLNREGVQLHTFFKQGNTRLNSEFKLSDKITIGEHLNVSFTNRNSENRIQEALRMNPLIPVYDEDGFFGGSQNNISTGNSRNPVAGLYRSRDNFNKMLRAFGDVYINADLGGGLSAKSRLSGMMQYFNGRYFNALDPEHGEPLSTNTLTETDYSNTSWTWTNSLNYVKSFGDHNLNAIVGIEALDENSKGKTITRTGYLFETPNFYLLNNGSGAANVASAWAGGSSLFSIFGTASYSYNDKYFFTGTVRQDTSSRFKGDNKTDIFPSFSGGWLMSNEDFFPQDGFVSRFRVKGSWGEIGNQTLPANNPTINISNLSESLANYALDGSNASLGAVLSQVGNPNLRWETSEAINLGFEVGMMDNQMRVNLDLFSIKTKDLVTRDNSLISTTAIDAGAPLVNLGNVENTGFDFSLGYNNTTDSGFNYDIQANISHYKNTVTNLISAFQSGSSGYRGGAITRTEVGQPISYFYGRNVTGYDSNGRFTYEDVNGDGQINDSDRTFIGSPHPDFTFGVNFSANYKNFDMSLFINGSQGNEAYNYDRIYTDFPTFVNGNRSTRVLDSWTSSNTDAPLPALSLSIGNAETQPNSFFVEDASFIKLKNLQIGYSLSDDATSKLGVDSLRFYLQGTNLITITDYTGFDPEIPSGNNLTLGVDSNVYPTSRIMSLGLNLKL